MVNDPDTIRRGDNTFVVIVAAGSGTRFGADRPKQFLDLDGKPVLMHTIEAFRHALPAAQIVIVLSPVGREIWREICTEHSYLSPAIITGGDTRSESVYRALLALKAARLTDADSRVLIHDGARPLVHPDVIRRVNEALHLPGIEAAMPVLPLTDALAQNDGDFCRPADRSAFCAAQTPQGFKLDMLVEAYDKSDGRSMPDDAAVAYTFGGHEIFKVPGHPQNIKITHPTDLEIAAVYMRNPLPYKD